MATCTAVMTSETFGPISVAPRIWCVFASTTAFQKPSPA